LVRVAKEKKIAHEKVQLIAKLAAEKKGQDIVLMDMQGISAVCDWFILVSAGSTRRIKAISRAIEEGLSKKKISPLHVEGRHDPHWVLLDYVDVVVHVFYKDVRAFYGLERLWSDAPREHFDGKCLKKTFQGNFPRSS